MSTASADPAAKFHVSLNVADIGRSADFYAKFLDRKAMKQTSDYAKFEMDEPPLVLSLISSRRAPGGNLNHIGIRLADFESLVRMQTRLEVAGIATKREKGVECCHSRQTKFWVNDPDATLWELYILHSEINEHGDEAHSHHEMESAPEVGTKIVWQHQIPERFPERIPHDDNSVHEVILEGSANATLEFTLLDTVLGETHRVLRPGGEITLHGLAGDKPFQRVPPRLPGPAAVVEHVPIENEPLKAMIRAGFVQVRFAKLSAAPVYVVDDVQMREFLLVGLKPGHRPQRKTHVAIYLGPLKQVEDDFGNVFPRGERVSLNIQDWQALSLSAVADQFHFFDPETERKAMDQALRRFSSSPVSTS